MKHLANTLAAFVPMLVLLGCATQASRLDERALYEPDKAGRLIVVTVRNERSAVAPRAGSTARNYASPPSYTVAPATQAQVRSITATYRLREVSAWPIGLLNVHCLVYEIPPGADRDELIERLRRDPRVESVQPFNAFRTLTSPRGHLPRGEPYRPLQRNLDAMNVGAAHRWSRGEGVRVAIVDAGVDVDHPDLSGRIAAYRDFVGPERARSNADLHGTAVAGLIGAIDNNGLGIVGVAPAARLYAFRACWSDSEASSAASCNTLTLAKALAAAIDARMQIVNLSLGGPADPLLTRLVRFGLGRGIVFVGATPPANADDMFPTAIAGVIGVDVVGSARSAESTLFAPGEQVLTLTPNGSYDFLSGSSLAAASVSGGIALLLARKRTLTAGEIHTLLASSQSSPNVDSPATVNLCAALAQLLSQGSCQ